MRLYNTLTKTSPIVLHSPGVHGLKNPLFRKAIRLSKKTEVQNATIITWNSTKRACLLEQHQQCVVLGQGVDVWHNSMKAVLAKEFIESVTTKYIMAFDGFDVLVFDPQQVVERFEETGYEMFVATDRTYFPYCGEPLTGSWKKFQETVGKGEYRYLNGGAWIAKTEFLKDFIKRWVSKIEEVRLLVENGTLPRKIPGYVLACGHIVTPKKSPDKSDQMAFNGTFCEFYPNIQLDYSCSVFQTLNACNDVYFVDL